MSSFVTSIIRSLLILSLVYGMASGLYAEDTSSDVLVSNTAQSSWADSNTQLVSHTLSNVSTILIKGSDVPVETAQIRFLTPTLDIKKSGITPTFTHNNDFIDAPYYARDNGLGNYQQTRDGIYVELISSSINKDPNVAETRIVTITSGDDTLNVTLLETAPDSGVFRSIRSIRLSESKYGAGGNCPASKQSINPDYNTEEKSCVLNALSNTRLNVESEDPGVGELLVDVALIDPLGIVFNSANNQPIANAVVTVYNDATKTIALDPFTDQPYDVQITGADGRYQYPFLYPGNYYLEVIANGYTAPSRIAAEQFPTRTVTPYSYGREGFTGTADGAGIFTLAAGDLPLVVDIPVDPIPVITNILLIEKTTPTTTASIGGFINYSLKIENKTGQNLKNIVVNDQLPTGFRYVKGTSTLDGKQITDPLTTLSSLQYNNLGFIDAQQPGALDSKIHILNYRLRVTAAAMDSNGINTAFIQGETPTNRLIESIQSRVKVNIRQDGILDNKGIIFGKIYVDTDCNNEQTTGEWPIGGVKLYMEDGTWVITDGNGQYSLYGIKPGNHVLKVDPITLPDGIHLKPTDNRHMADPDSRLVDLIKGEFHKADFVASCAKEDTEYVYQQIMARNTGMTDWMLDNAQKYDPNRRVTNDNFRAQAGKDGDLSNGSLDNSLNTASKKANSKISITRGYSLQTEKFSTDAKANKALEKLPISLREDAFIYQLGDFHALRIGFALDKERLNPLRNRLKRLSLKADTVATIYERLPIAVLDRLESPKNSLRMPDPKQVAKQITRKQAKKGTWLWPMKDISIDGRFMVVIRKGMTPTLKVNGVAVPSSQIGERISNKRNRAQVVAWYGVNLKEGKNTVEVTAKGPFGNMRTLAKGTFIRPANASKIKLIPSATDIPADGGRSYLPVTIKLLDKNGYPALGTHFVTLESTHGSWVERDIQDQVPGQQVRVNNGERIIHFRSSEFTGDVILRATTGSKLKAEKKIVMTTPLRPLIVSGILDLKAQHGTLNNTGSDPTKTTRLHGRAAFFMKGRVLGDKHLTLAVDTDKNTDGERFRDINPNTHYPLYGDSSKRGYEAQSRSKLYAKIEKGKNSAMWGDFLTDHQTSNEDVSRVQRSLTGGQMILDDGETRLQFYVSRAEENHLTEEIRGNGTAFNYRIDKRNIVRNSEVVEIVTYSRDNPGIVLTIKRLTRFDEYTLDHITGDLRFSDTIPALDENFNPVYIRLSYDVEDNGDTHNVAGIRLQHQLTDEIKLGISHSLDDNKTDGKHISGISAEYKKDELRIAGSVATLKHENGDEGGEAIRLSAEKRWGKNANTRFGYNRADTGFDNKTGGVAKGREEFRLNHKQKINKNISVNIEGIHSKELETEATQQSLGVTTDIKAGDWTFKGGVRHVKQHKSADNDSFTTFIVGLKHTMELMGKKGNISAEYEQDISQASRQRIAIGADLQVHEKIKLYARAERINSLTGVSGLSTSDQRDTLSIGIKSNVLPSTELYSEYRLRGAIGGRDMEAATGIRGTYEIEKGLSISPRLEVINSLKGNKTDSVAASVGLTDSRNSQHRKQLRVETRHDSHRDYYGIEGSYVGRLDEQWSLLARDSFRYDKSDNADKKYSNTFTVGLASRPRRNNKHNMLFQYQNKEQRGYSDKGDCSTHILSTHQSYEVNETLLLSGRFGGKNEKCTQGGSSSTANALAIDSRLTWDITRRWGMDVHGGALATDGMNEVNYSAGAGLDYLFKKNIRLGGGYNIIGFEEDDLDAEGYNKQGVYLGLQYKVDENSFDWLENDNQIDKDTSNDAGNLNNKKENKGLLNSLESWFNKDEER